MRLGLVLPRESARDWAMAADRVGLFGVVVGGRRGVECCVAGALSTCTSTTRLVVRLRVGEDHPLTLAEEVAVVDNLSNGRVVILADVGGLGPDEAREDVELLRAALSSRPIRHRGERWTIPAGLAGHEAPDAVMVTPQPAQVEVPIWITGIDRADVWDSRIAFFATTPDQLDETSVMRPGRAALGGDLDRDRDLVHRWAAGGASHLLLSPPPAWAPADLSIITRFLVPEVGMVGFPRVIASAPPPKPWPGS